VTTPRGRGSTAVPPPETLGWRTPSAGKSTNAKAQAHGSARVAPTLEMRASRLAVIVRRARRPRPARAGNFQAATLCRHCEMGIAALPCYRLQTTGRAANPSCLLGASENLARHIRDGGPFFATEPHTGRTGMEGAGIPSRLSSHQFENGGTPMKTPAPRDLHPNQGAAVTQRSP
jgi:hypothetical protein